MTNQAFGHGAFAYAILSQHRAHFSDGLGRLLGDIDHPSSFMPRASNHLFGQRNSEFAEMEASSRRPRYGVLEKPLDQSGAVVGTPKPISADTPQVRLVCAPMSLF